MSIQLILLILLYGTTILLICQIFVTKSKLKKILSSNEKLPNTVAYTQRKFNETDEQFIKRIRKSNNFAIGLGVFVVIITLISDLVDK